MPTNTPPTEPPDLSWKSATAALTAVTLRDTRRGASGLYSRWRADPAGHAVTALVTVGILAVMVLAQSARASVPASADVGPPALTRAAEMRATAVAVDTPEPESAAWGEGLPAGVTRWAAEIDAASAKHGVPARLIGCMIGQESGGQVAIPSPAGALGIMQLMPATARGLGLTVIEGEQDDRLDPVANIDAGVRYMRQQLDAYGGDVRTALIAYNGGGGAVAAARRGQTYTESRNYIAAIMPCYERGA